MTAAATLAPAAPPRFVSPPTRVSRRSLYGLVADEAYRDGHLEAWEDRLLQAVARSFEVTPEDARRIRQRSIQRYRAGKLGRRRRLDPRYLLRKVYAAIGPDGPADAVEAERVDRLRRAFRISPEEAEAIAAEAADHPLRWLRLVSTVGLATEARGATPPTPPAPGPVEQDAPEDLEQDAPGEAPGSTPAAAPRVEDLVADVEACLDRKARQVFALRAAGLPLGPLAQVALAALGGLVAWNVPSMVAGTLSVRTALPLTLAVTAAALRLGRRVLGFLSHPDEGELVAGPGGILVPGSLVGSPEDTVRFEAADLQECTLHLPPGSGEEPEAVSLVLGERALRFEAAAFDEELWEVARKLEKALGRRVQLRRPRRHALHRLFQLLRIGGGVAVGLAFLV